MTIMMPNTEAFENWIVANGGNSTDPDSLTTKEWASKWDAAFEYLCKDHQLAVYEKVLSKSEPSPEGHAQHHRR